MKSWLALSLVCLLGLSFGVPARADFPPEYAVSDYRRLVVMPTGKGPFQYYAQNDPIWTDTIYEAPRAPRQRPFGDGGCAPTALAMVVASMVPQDDLAKLADQGYKGAPCIMCKESLNELYCPIFMHNPAHQRYYPVTAMDFMHVLPLALGNYAAGNNPQRIKYRVGGSLEDGNGGTSSNLFAPIAKLFGIKIGFSYDIEDVYKTLDRGGMAIALCSGGEQAFSNGPGHYVVLADHDDTFIYVLDPFLRDKYPRDYRKVVLPIEDGVKKVEKEKLRRAGFNRFYLFSHSAPVATLPPAATARSDAE